VRAYSAAFFLRVHAHHEQKAAEYARTPNASRHRKICGGPTGGKKQETSILGYGSSAD